MKSKGTYRKNHEQIIRKTSAKHKESTEKLKMNENHEKCQKSKNGENEQIEMRSFGTL